MAAPMAAPGDPQRQRDGGFLDGARLGRHRRRRRSPAMPRSAATTASPRRTQRGADGRAAAAGGCRPVCRGRGDFCAGWASARRVWPRTPTGFLLIEDFGDDTYTRLLAGGADEPALYALAIDTLIALQRGVGAPAPPALPPYDEARLLGRGGAAGRLVHAGGARRAAAAAAARGLSRALAGSLAAGGGAVGRPWCCATITSTI